MVVQDGLHVVADLLERDVAAHGLELGVLEELFDLLGALFKKAGELYALIAHAGELLQNALQIAAGVLARGIELVSGGEMFAHGKTPLRFFKGPPRGPQDGFRDNILFPSVLFLPCGKILQMS